MKPSTCSSQRHVGRRALPLWPPRPSSIRICARSSTTLQLPWTSRATTRRRSRAGCGGRRTGRIRCISRVCAGIMRGRAHRWTLSRRSTTGSKRSRPCLHVDRCLRGRQSKNVLRSWRRSRRHRPPCRPCTSMDSATRQTLRAWASRTRCLCPRPRPTGCCSRWAAPASTCATPTGCRASPAAITTPKALRAATSRGRWWSSAQV
mmetsp:Transcript_71228/g.141228  ORF Transcript_71228/g.141228 Transcript_71228/m.141228 type:complete len:205 (-) Transcript_71228:815-1429(-)